VPFYTLMGSLYGLNAIVAIFCSSSYKVSVLSRLLIYANIIIIGVYRVRAGFNPVG